MTHCHVLSKLRSKKDKNSDDYVKEIYNYFKDLFFTRKLYYNRKPVHIRRSKYKGEEWIRDAFEHYTKRDNYITKREIRVIDYYRTERLHWIEEILNEENCIDDKCDGILIWEEKRNKNPEVLFYCEENRYLIILQKLEKFYVLLSAHVVGNKKHYKLINQYDQCNSCLN